MLYVPQGWGRSPGFPYGINVEEYNFQNVDAPPIIMQLHPVAKPAPRPGVRRCQLVARERAYERRGIALSPRQINGTPGTGEGACLRLAGARCSLGRSRIGHFATRFGARCRGISVDAQVGFRVAARLPG